MEVTIDSNIVVSSAKLIVHYSKLIENNSLKVCTNHLFDIGDNIIYLIVNGVDVTLSNDEDLLYSYEAFMKNNRFLKNKTAHPRVSVLLADRGILIYDKEKNLLKKIRYKAIKDFKIKEKQLEIYTEDKKSTTIMTGSLEIGIRLFIVINYLTKGIKE